MKIKFWPNDATSLGEKILYTAGAIVPVALYAFMILSAVGLFHNFYQQNVKAAAPGWHIAGTLVTIIEVLFTISVIEEKDHIFKGTIGEVIAIAVTAVLSLLTFAGFVFNIG